MQKKKQIQTVYDLQLLIIDIQTKFQAFFNIHKKLFCLVYPKNIFLHYYPCSVLLIH